MSLNYGFHIYEQDRAKAERIHGILRQKIKEEYEEEHIITAINIPAYKDKDHSDYGAVDRIVGEFRKIKEENPDAAWLDGLESQMAETGVAIAAARLDFTMRLQNSCDQGGREEEDFFPKAKLAVKGTIEELLQNPDTAMQMGKAGRKCVEDHFTIKQQIEKYLKAIGLWERRDNKAGTYSNSIKAKRSLCLCNYV